MNLINILTSFASNVLDQVGTYIGALFMSFGPIVAFFALGVLALIGDVYTANRLNKRVFKLYPNKSNGKFTSKKFDKALNTLLKLLFMLYLASGLDTLVITGTSFIAVRIVTGIFCFGQVWSMLENESSSTDSKWAKILQNIMVDKTTRHFDLKEGTFDSLTNKDDNKNV